MTKALPILLADTFTDWILSTAMSRDTWFTLILDTYRPWQKLQVKPRDDGVAKDRNSRYDDLLRTLHPNNIVDSTHLTTGALSAARKYYLRSSCKRRFAPRGLSQSLYPFPYRFPSFLLYLAWKGICREMDRVTVIDPAEQIARLLMSFWQ